MDYSSPGSSIRVIFLGKIPGVVAIFFSVDLPDPGIKLRAPALQADSLPSEPPGNPWNYKTAWETAEGSRTE